MLISQCHFDGPPYRTHGSSPGPAGAGGLPEAHGPPKVHGHRGRCPPCPPLTAALNGYENNYLLVFIVLNNIFANVFVKKTCASPTKSLTARHWLNVTWLSLLIASVYSARKKIIIFQNSNAIVEHHTTSCTIIVLASTLN